MAWLLDVANQTFLYLGSAESDGQLCRLFVNTPSLQQHSQRLLSASRSRRRCRRPPPPLCLPSRPRWGLAAAEPLLRSERLPTITVSRPSRMRAPKLLLDAAIHHSLEARRRCFSPSSGKTLRHARSVVIPNRIGLACAGFHFPNLNNFRTRFYGRRVLEYFVCSRHGLEEIGDRLKNAEIFAYRDEIHRLFGNIHLPTWTNKDQTVIADRFGYRVKRYYSCVPRLQIRPSVEDFSF